MHQYKVINSNVQKTSDEQDYYVFSASLIVNFKPKVNRKMFSETIQKLTFVCPSSNCSISFIVGSHITDGNNLVPGSTCKINNKNKINQCFIFKCFGADFNFICSSLDGSVNGRGFNYSARGPGLIFWSSSAILLLPITYLLFSVRKIIIEL